MASISEQIEEELEGLRTLRDELRVKLHLGAAEVQEQWEELDRKWSHAEGRLKVIREEAAEAAEDVGEAARLLVNELRNGYEQIRRLL